MKHPKHFYKLVLGFCLCAALMATAAQPASVSKDELAAQKELLQIQIDSKKELLQKDIESQNKQLEALDKRIDDQSNRVGDIGASVDRFGVISAWICGLVSILITGLMILIGLVTYRGAKADARQAAEEIAKESSQRWFEENNKKLNTRLEELENKAGEAISEIKIHTQDVKALSENAKKEIVNQKNISLDLVNLQPLDSSIIEPVGQKIEERPEDSYSFEDWNNRAFSAYKENKLNDAAFYWRKAAEIPRAGAINFAKAILNGGITLGQLGRYDEALFLFNVLIEKYNEDLDPALREQVVKARLSKGVALGQLNRNEEALIEFSNLITKYSEDTQFLLDENISNAMMNKAFALAQLNRKEESIVEYENLISKYKNVPKITLFEKVANAMLSKGIVLGELNRADESIVEYDSLIAKYSENSHLALRELVAKATYNKAGAFGQLSRKDEAIAIYNTVITNFIDSTQFSTFELAMRALINKASLLSDLNRLEEAIAVNDEFISKYANAAQPGLLDKLVQVMSNKGFNFICLAKKMWDQPEKAKNLLEQARSVLSEAIGKNVPNGYAYGNLAYVFWLKGNSEFAELHFKTGLHSKKHGGEELYRATLKDFEIHPITPDEGFKILIEKLWVDFQQNQKPIDLV